MPSSLTQSTQADTVDKSTYTSSSRYSDIIVPTLSSSGIADSNDGARLSSSDKVTIGLTVGIALPGTIAGIAGAYFAYAILRRKRNGSKNAAQKTHSRS